MAEGPEVKIDQVALIPNRVPQEIDDVLEVQDDLRGGVQLCLLAEGERWEVAEKLLEDFVIIIDNQAKAEMIKELAEDIETARTGGMGWVTFFPFSAF